MKTIGLIGGISWQSTVEYYRIINSEVNRRTGEKHSAKILLDSVDIGEVDTFVSNGDFEGLTRLIVASARRLEQAGAELLLIGANTMHFIAPQVQENISIPLIHILDPVIREIRKQELTKVGLLGTRFTMEQDFYKNKLTGAGIDVVVPEAPDREIVHQIIITELFKAILNPVSKQKFLGIIDALTGNGAQGIILGCTEIPLLINQSDCTVPVFDTTELHSLAAVDHSL